MDEAANLSAALQRILPRHPALSSLLSDHAKLQAEKGHSKGQATQLLRACRSEADEHGRWRVGEEWKSINSTLRSRWLRVCFGANFAGSPRRLLGPRHGAVHSLERAAWRAQEPAE